MTKGISRAEVARRLKVSPRTVGRLASEGIVERYPDGTFDEESVSQALENKEALLELSGEDNSASAELISHVIKEAEASRNHAERMLQLVEKPMAKALETLTAVTDAALKRISEQESTNIQMMQALGEILLQKAEREAVALQGAVKAKVLGESGSKLAEAIPKLLDQIGGKTVQTAGMFSKFLGSLDDDEKAGLWSVAGFFDGEKRAMFEAALKSAGIEKPQEKKEAKNDDNSEKTDNE